MNTVETLNQTSAQGEPQYPPAPWNLQGQLYGSIWTVPAAALQVQLPEPFRPLVNFGRVGVFAGFVDYQPGSPLVYHELIAGLVVRLAKSWRFAMHVTHIWVDDAASRRGGREIWGVPKELAEFKYHYERQERDLQGEARREGQLLASGQFHSVVGLPRRIKLPTPFPNLQIVDEKPQGTSATYWSNVQFCRGGMTIPAESPLAELGVAGRKPLVSFAGLDFRMKLQAPQPVTTAP